MKCTNCGSEKHTIANCMRTASGLDHRMSLHCANCLKRDHNTVACPHTDSGKSDRIHHPERVEDEFVED